MGKGGLPRITTLPTLQAGTTSPLVLVQRELESRAPRVSGLQGVRLTGSSSL